MTELSDWVGERAQAGRMAPRGFPKSNKFGPVILSRIAYWPFCDCPLRALRGAAVRAMGRGN